MRSAAALVTVTVSVPPSSPMLGTTAAATTRESVVSGGARLSDGSGVAVGDADVVAIGVGEIAVVGDGVGAPVGEALGDGVSSATQAPATTITRHASATRSERIMPRSRRAREPMADGIAGRLRAALEAELGEDTRDIVADRLLRQPHAFGDVPIGRPVGKVREDASFLLGEIGEGAGLLEAARVSKTLEHALGDGGVEQRSAGRNRAHRIHQLGRADPLEDVARRARVDRREERIGVRVAGEHHDRGRRELSGDGAAGIDPRTVRHPDVHHDHVRTGLARQPHRLVARAGLADDAESRLSIEQRGETDADHLVVVGDEDAHVRDGRGGVGC